MRRAEASRTYRPPSPPSSSTEIQQADRSGPLPPARNAPQTASNGAKLAPDAGFFLSCFRNAVQRAGPVWKTTRPRAVTKAQRVPNRQGTRPRIGQRLLRAPLLLFRYIQVAERRPNYQCHDESAAA